MARADRRGLAGLSPLLIANRGEIAVRVARTAHELGLRTIGTFTAPDAAALHVDTVDQALRIDSYLGIDEILTAAERAGARSVHPGYGFLAENPAFARAVIDAGLAWVGPPPEAIELMGDKARAKRAAAEAGLPVIPAGDDGGFPVVVKPVAGGGGKGMRVVRSPEGLEEATAAAKREAMAAFGDDRVLIERWIERPRHIEVQILADRHGAVVHLGERECSLQRRHQKVVEEAPSPVVTPELRQRIGGWAVELSRACGYQGAGTIELIATADASELFFLEMNTRLQVEHPVTELIYGLDLVELQLRIAAGKPLGLAQGELALRGHAVEARLYAEDPAAGFLPAAGTVRRYREPDGVRIDSGIRAGSEIGTEFDPLLAKLIAHGPDREQALGRLGRALGGLELLGVQTTAAFTRVLLGRTDVRAGDLDTGLLERALEELDHKPPEDLLPAAALAAAGTARPAGPWRRAFEAGEARVHDGTVRVGVRSSAAEVRALADGSFAIELDGIRRRYLAEVGEEAVWIGRDGHQLEARTRRRERDEAAAAAGSLEAPMPGTVLQVRVADGDRVEEGDVLVVLESMKMEMLITAPHAGVVAELAHGPGDRVALGEPLVAVHPNGEAR